MDRYEGRRVLVTGAGSGIGQGIVLRLLAEGAQLVAADRDAAGLETTAKMAGDDVADRLKTVVVDISSESSVQDAYAESLDYLGGLDVLVNAAGILLTARTHEMPLETWQKVIDVNLTGTFLMVKAGLPTLLESPHGGVVVNFSSTSAFFAHPYMAAYAASKGAITAFTHSIALEYVKQGLRAVNIVPGGVKSGITTKSILDLPEGFDSQLFGKLLGWIGGGNFGNPEDIAGVVAMVASDDGKFITGTEIRIDGGAHM